MSATPSSSTCTWRTPRRDARSGRLVKSTINSNYESLRFVNSSGSFSPDGRYFAITAKRKQHEDLVILDVKRHREDRRIQVPLNGLETPSWSPDGHQLVFTGFDGGLSDLFIINRDGTGLRRLTNDKYADLQPGLVARRQDHRLRDRSRRPDRFRRAALRQHAPGALPPRWRNDRDAGAHGRGQEHRSRLGTRRPLARLRLRPHRHQQSLSVRPRGAGGLPAHRRLHRGVRHHAVVSRRSRGRARPIGWPSRTTRTASTTCTPSTTRAR